ncbi:MAG: hypothetical protein EBY78_06780, partial [Actinobacteria bacterium]|nr:hypothetical protein [Actinomycetota bacterium]
LAGKGGLAGKAFSIHPRGKSGTGAPKTPPKFGGSGGFESGGAKASGSQTRPSHHGVRKPDENVRESWAVFGLAGQGL